MEADTDTATGEVAATEGPSATSAQVPSSEPPAPPAPPPPPPYPPPPAPIFFPSLQQRPAPTDAMRGSGAVGPSSSEAGSVDSWLSSRWLNPQAARYVALCRQILAEPDSDVLIVFQLRAKQLSFSKGLPKCGLLPVGEILKTDAVLTHLDLSYVRLGNAGAYVLADVLKHNRTLKHLNLTRCEIGVEGALALAEALRYNDTLEVLELRSNRLIGATGALAIGQALTGRGQNPRPLKLDVTDCMLGFGGVEALMELSFEGAEPPTLLTDGNFMVEEILNVISHGFGCILTIVGSLILMRQPTPSTIDYTAKLVYCVSLFTLYLASTMCHGFHNFKSSVKKLFGILDHCSIYLLIAGTYTPLAVICMGHTPQGMGLVVAQWACALAGIAGHLYGLPSVLELSLYAGMGWMITPFISTFKANIAPEGFHLVVLGGVLYTSGIYFYAVGNKVPSYHVVWHMFVLAASLVHYLAILWYCIPPGQAGEAPAGGVLFSDALVA
eukprot:CAMPEP_0118924710 /NCGR_PEP_ID=MMETSP1169-20130426/2718_1 /TAXON_ID=36882 /ORGANISM="Pyramimonas obovata, Strain CCMP722" /LENGTH=496 /DNA_ID=CAMNT_0006865841 /DNA_START=268 /DNA_END=1757 /DNA_ORIENTATION=+